MSIHPGRHAARPGRATVRRSFIALATLTLATLASTTANAAELVMFDGKWCGRCKQFLAEVAPTYHATAPGKAMPLRVVDLQRTRPWFRLAAPVEGTPTFVLVDQGAERGRITGYTSRDAFLQQAHALMVANAYRAPKQKPRVRDQHAQLPQHARGRTAQP